MAPPSKPLLIFIAETLCCRSFTTHGRCSRRRNSSRAVAVRYATIEIAKGLNRAGSGSIISAMAEHPSDYFDHVNNVALDPPRPLLVDHRGAIDRPSSRARQRETFEANKLKKRLRRLVGQAIADFHLIEPGDRVMVCV